jgi:hypothetical protein
MPKKLVSDTFLTRHVPGEGKCARRQYYSPTAGLRRRAPRSSLVVPFATAEALWLGCTASTASHAEPNAEHGGATPQSAPQVAIERTFPLRAPLHRNRPRTIRSSQQRRRPGERTLNGETCRGLAPSCVRHFCRASQSANRVGPSRGFDPGVND